MYPTSTQKAQPNRADSPQQASTTMSHRGQHAGAGGRENLEEAKNRRLVRLEWLIATTEHLD